MRLASARGRLHLLVDDAHAVDVAQASAGALPSSPAAAFGCWDELVAWAGRGDFDVEPAPFDLSAAEAISPAPRQVFAVGFNYDDHARESGVAGPDAPQIFTKFPSSLAAPYADLELPSETIDWEVELVAVVGREARHVAAADAWDRVAGLTVGQDFSDRELQMQGDYPQYSLAKSFPGFGPLGPVLVTPDEFTDPDDLELSCSVNGEVMQSSRTSSMIHPVPALVAHLSAVCTLYPGDLIFTGTPSGVGMARSPRRYLRPGDVVVSRIEGIGEIRQRCLEAPAAPQQVQAAHGEEVER